MTWGCSDPVRRACSSHFVFCTMHAKLWPAWRSQLGVIEPPECSDCRFKSLLQNWPHRPCLGWWMGRVMDGGGCTIAFNPTVQPQPSSSPPAAKRKQAHGNATWNGPAHPNKPRHPGGEDDSSQSVRASKTCCPLWLARLGGILMWGSTESNWGRRRRTRLVFTSG